MLPLVCLEFFSLDCNLSLSTRFKEVILETDLDIGHVWLLPVVVAESLDLSVSHLDSLVDTFQMANYSLAGRFTQSSSLVSIKGMIGLDLVWHSGPL